MAATGFTPLQLYYSLTASNVPLAANLVSGELALNTVDGKLYFKDNTNTVKLLASTSALQSVYPVGCIYTSTVATNPSSIFGFGTWVAFGAGRVAIGAGGGYTAGATGGSADSIVPSHNHTFVGDALAPHSHGYITATNGTSTPGGAAQCAYYGSAATTSTASAGTPSGTISTTGVSGTNANLPPYIVVYLWNRTA